MEVILALLAVAGWFAAIYLGVRLYRWERQLAGARVAVAYKQKVKMDAPLVDWLKWANMLRRDEQARGRVVYRMGGTSVAILKPRPRSHGKTTTTHRKPESKPVTVVTGNK